MDLMEEEQVVINFPDLETIDLSDIEVQKELILLGVAVGVPGGEVIFTKNCKLIAGRS